MPKLELSRRSFASLAGMTAAMGLAACASEQGRQEETIEATPAEDFKADLVIRGANVQTMVAEDDVAEAVAVKGNEILFVGTAADVEQYVSDTTHIIDLGGGFVCPGFADGHLHAPGSSIDATFNCILTNFSTNEEYLEALEQHVQENPDREAYFGIDFTLSVYQGDDGSNPGPDKADLDAICPDKPMVVYDVSHRNIWVNSKALELGGVTKGTPDPEGGYIYREDDGTPHGCLADTARELIPVVQSYTEEQYRKACRAFMAECNSYGMTGITNIDTLGPEGMRIYHEMEEAGELTLRMNYVSTCAAGTDPKDTLELIQANQSYASDMLTAKTVKMFADGVIEGGTAWMLEPYVADAKMGDDWHGSPQWSDGDLKANVKLFDKAGVQVHIHAIGDAAVRQAIDAYAAAKSSKLRHTITHVCAIADDDIQRMADNDIVAALQFAWMYRDALCELEETYVGEERARAFYPTRSMWDAGVRICGSSDGPGTSLNPLEEMEVGITRNSPYFEEEDYDYCRWPEQALTAYELLQAYTSNVAYENFQEELVGTIEVGKKADLVCLDTNILTCDPKQISDTAVLYTISDGRVVYEG